MAFLFLKVQQRFLVSESRENLAWRPYFTGTVRNGSNYDEKRVQWPLSVTCIIRPLGNLTRTVSQLNDRVEVTLQWIPAHCGVHGKESADIVAKVGSCSDQHDKAAYNKR